MDRMREALDRHITGNYGEDQLREEPLEPTEAEAACPKCGAEFDAHTEVEGDNITYECPRGL